MTDRARVLTSRVAALASAGLLALTLAACAADPAPTPTPGSTASPSPTGTPTGTPTNGPTPSGDPTDPADPGTWVVDLVGIGPVALGATLPEVLPQLGAFSSLEMPADCSVSVFAGQGEAERLRLSIVLDRVGGSIVQAFVMTDGAPEAPPASGPATEHGIALGDTEAELLEAYPDAVQLQDVGYAIYELEAGAGTFVYSLVSRPNADGTGDALVYGLVSSSVPGVAADFCV